jgi:hypothetical protein
MTDDKLRALRSMGNLCAEAADEIYSLGAQLSAARQAKPAAVVRSVAKGEVRVTWLAGFPQIGDRLYCGPRDEA